MPDGPFERFQSTSILLRQRPSPKLAKRRCVPSAGCRASLPPLLALDHLLSTTSPLHSTTRPTFRTHSMISLVVRWSDSSRPVSSNRRSFTVSASTPQGSAMSIIAASSEVHISSKLPPTSPKFPVTRCHSGNSGRDLLKAVHV